MRTRLALLTLLFVAVAAPAQTQGDSMKNDAPIRTLCLGRFLVDVPKDVDIISHATEYRADKITTTRRVSPDTFQQLIDQKEKTLRETKHQTEPSLLKSIEKGGDGHSVVIVFREAPTSKALYNTEAYKWMRGTQFFIRSYASPNKTLMAVEMANRSLSELRYRGDDEIPSEPGFCIDGGFFAGEPEGPHYEQTKILFRLKQHPDVIVGVSTWVVMKEGKEGLLARVDRKPIPDDLKSLVSEVKTLRRGERRVGTMVGEELLETLPLGDTFSTHLFRWEAGGAVKQLYAPQIIVEFETGETPGHSITRPTLTDKQAVELFDNIVNSIRRRPTGPASAVGASGPKEPSAPAAPRTQVLLGTTLASGERCPQSGTWQCAEPQAIGGDRRVFSAGETFPSVLVPVERGLVQRLKGEAANRLSETTWSLVAYPEKKV